MSARKPKSSKPLPRFTSEDKERRFWSSHDVVDYFDWNRAVQPTFPNLRPTTTSISIRLSVSMLEELKALANAQDVPYQSLMKVFLSERLVRERHRRVPA
jgi:predicted DNA binding CopG/RHH family protein